MSTRTRYQTKLYDRPYHSCPHLLAHYLWTPIGAWQVGSTYQYYEHVVPIVHFARATPPFVTCVALDRTDGAFEANLASLGLTEGDDYYLFG
jgi:hypothetical protein